MAVEVGAGQGMDDAEMIRSTEQRIAKAWVDRDRSALDAILAPEWSVTDASGRVLTKAQVLDEAFASTERRIDSMAIDDVRDECACSVMRRLRRGELEQRGAIEAPRHP